MIISSSLLSLAVSSFESVGWMHASIGDPIYPGVNFFTPYILVLSKCFTIGLGNCFMVWDGVRLLDGVGWWDCFRSTHLTYWVGRFRLLWTILLFEAGLYSPLTLLFWVGPTTHRVDLAHSHLEFEPSHDSPLKEGARKFPVNSR